MYMTREFSNSCEMSKLAIDSMIDYAVYILSKRGVIISANSGAKNLTGFMASDVTGTHFARFYRMEEISRKSPENELKMAKRNNHFEGENWFVRKNGTMFWASVIINRLNDLHGTHIGYSAILKDLTAKKNQVDALKNAELCAQRALKLKSQFIADISHEIRTPLGAMLGFAEFLQKEDIPKEDRQHYLDIILKNGKNLNRVIDDVLDLSKIEAGQINIEMNEFNLHGLLEEVLDLFREQCKNKNLTLSYTSNFDNGYVISDAVRIRQILSNILSNAIKFTEEGEIIITVEKIEETEEKCEFKINVRDSGIGLSQKEINKLFRPFVQIAGSHQKNMKGSGLGLVLSRRMAQALGGNMELISAGPGKGSVFSFTFADYKTLKIPPATKPNSTEPLIDSLESKSILIVDDSVDNLEIIKLFLSSYGGDPDVAINGAEALLKMQSKTYDVILMDIEMPEMNGFQVIKELRSRKYKTPVIALTAHALPEDRLKTKNAGFFEHVTKPIDFGSLVSMIQTLH
jgi:PAS domain S-box-containing protein